MHAIVAGLILFPASPAPDIVSMVRDTLRVEGTAWKSTVMTGKADYYSEPAKYSLQFDASGKFVQNIDGKLGESYGYDGKTYWQADRSGATRKLNFSDVDMQQAFMLVQSNAWLNPPLGVTVTSTSGNTVVIKLPSGLEEELLIDPLTKLPMEATYTASSGEVKIKLSDWRPAGAWKLPFKTEITMGGLIDTFQADSAKEATEGSYAMPEWKPTNITFDSSKPALLQTKKLMTGHLIVHPYVNGKDVGWFILDSGADIMVIDPKVADNLKMPKIGKLPLVGIGGVITGTFRTMDSFELGQATLTDTHCAELDFSPFKEIFKIDIAGIIGYDLFRRSVISVDLDKPAISLHDPATFKLENGEWTPTLFSAGNVAVEAEMEGNRSGWYRIDTGANGSVQFHTPYVEKEKLLEKREVTTSHQAGVGGISAGKMGRIEWFELAGHRFHQPEVVFSQATIGAFNDRYLAGNIGQEFLKPFTLHFDFGNSRVAFIAKS